LPTTKLRGSINMPQLMFCALLSCTPVWLNYRAAGRMWPTPAFLVARRNIQNSLDLKFVKKHVMLHLYLNCLRWMKYISRRTYHYCFCLICLFYQIRFMGLC